MIRFGFGKEDITPKRGIGLCGYFEPRYNKGAHDPLTVKAALFESNGIVSGIVSYDLCLMGRSMVEKIKAAVREGGFSFAENLLYSCTHTHTGPYTSAVFSDGADQKYLESVIAKTVMAIRNAYEGLAEASLRKGFARNSSLAFNRRFWMKDGTVLTNPGKLNPAIVKPEGGIDDSIPFLVVEQDGLDRLIVANISNHTDTIGDDLVSADWPGRMEREIQNHYGYDIAVITLIGCQGNINHFNVRNDVNQTCYAEACRIGKGYAASILSMLYATEKMKADSIQVESVEFDAPFYHVTDEEYNEAKKIVEEIGEISATSANDLTSEGIAAGNLYVKKFFAQRVLDNREKPAKDDRKEYITALKFGDELGIVTLPAEPFVEIGLAIKEHSRFESTMVAALTQGEIGYVGLPESYGRGGGYETRPGYGSPSHELAPVLVETATKLINK